MPKTSAAVANVSHRLTPTLLAYLAAPNDLLAQWGELKRDAKCKGKNATDAFFGAENHSPRAAQMFCDQCPINTACLAYALIKKEEHGIWGGLTIRGRKAVQRALRQHAA